MFEHLREQLVEVLCDHFASYHPVVPALVVLCRPSYKAIHKDMHCLHEIFNYMKLFDHIYTWLVP